MHQQVPAIRSRRNLLHKQPTHFDRRIQTALNLTAKLLCLPLMLTAGVRQRFCKVRIFGLVTTILSFQEIPLSVHTRPRRHTCALRTIW